MEEWKCTGKSCLKKKLREQGEKGLLNGGEKYVL